MIIVILLIVVGAAYVLGTQNSNTPALTVNNSTTSTVITEKTTDTTKRATNTTNSTPNTNITAQQAINIVQQEGNDPQDPNKYKATNPRLVKVQGTYYWKVHFAGGDVYVNANTGEYIPLL